MTKDRQPPDERTFESRQSFHIAVGPDGVSRTIGMTETFSDGSTRHVVYEDVPTDDPYVQLRQRIAGEDPSSEVTTQFLPSPVRPPTYPSGLPFLAGRRSYTKESPGGSMAPQVRWRCSDPDALLAELIESLTVEGWTRAPLSTLPQFIRGRDAQVFMRGNAIYTVRRHDFGSESNIDVEDLTASWRLLGRE